MEQEETTEKEGKRRHLDLMSAMMFRCEEPSGPKTSRDLWISSSIEGSANCCCSYQQDRIGSGV
jgi:hypothetical protein